MKIFKSVKTFATISAFSVLPLHATKMWCNSELLQDQFILTDSISPKGCTSSCLLASAPSSDIYINTEMKKATIVVDLSKNYLYKYDSNGNPTEVFLVASGKKSTPTDTGIRIVSHVETYPYRNASKATKRRRNPKAYGPKIIILNKLNPTNGEQSSCGEFIHGNNDPSSIGKYASLGCIRMDNEVIKELSKQVKRGDIVKIIK